VWVSLSYRVFLVHRWTLFTACHIGVCFISVCVGGVCVSLSYRVFLVHRWT